MTTSQQMFLLAAQELNFTRASERAHVTPQCLSDHIKRIEEQYGMALFYRKPRLHLTPEGETMLRYITRMRTLENDMKNELADVSAGTRGVLRVGMPTTRGDILIPTVVSQFRERFPNVDVEVRLNDTRTLEELLLGGEIDLFLGINAGQHALFARVGLFTEPLFLVIPRNIMQARFGEQYGDIRREFLRSGADMHMLQDVPFVQGHYRSKTTIAFEQTLMRQNVRCTAPIHVSNFDLHIAFNRMGRYASVCSRAHLYKIMMQEDDNLEVYTIRGAQEHLEVELISHRDADPLVYRAAFANMLAQYVRETDEELRRWIKKQGIFF